MENKIILDLCGGSGAWSKPWRDAGYDVRVLTLPEYDVTKFTFREPYWGIEMHPFGYEQSTERLRYEDIYGILAAPPCTEFSVAKGNRPRDLAEGMRIVRACLDVIWHCQIHGRLKFWALENPRGLLRQFLGVPHYTFEQWQFGGNKRKATDIWGYFVEPTPSVKAFPAELVRNDWRTRVHAADWIKLECPEEYADYINRFRGDDRRAAIRAITLAGFAEAFYKVNK
jgi:hypothetical protein